MAPGEINLRSDIKKKILDGNERNDFIVFLLPAWIRICRIRLLEYKTLILTLFRVKEYLCFKLKNLDLVRFVQRETFCVESVL